VYSLTAETWGRVPAYLVLAAMLCGASAMVGGLLGFLFGIPRTLQEQPAANGTQPPSAAAPVGEAAIAGAMAQHPAGREQATLSRSGRNDNQPVYRPNTSLEQISDWLTKILVGVGLTQIAPLQTYFNQVITRFANGFGGTPADEAFVAALICLNVVAGFLFGFLWTRIYLPGAFLAADRSLLGEEVRSQVRTELKTQSDADAVVLGLVDRQLSLSGSLVSEGELLAALQMATPTARFTVLNRARQILNDHFYSQRNQAAVERTIPVFRALTRSDLDPLSHFVSFGQLGFALKDKPSPEWEAAAKELSEAIRLRDEAGVPGYRYYELARAVCRVNLDPNFLENPPQVSSDEIKAKILDDLREVIDSGIEIDLDRTDKLKNWLVVNHLTLEEIQSR